MYCHTQRQSCRIVSRYGTVPGDCGYLETVVETVLHGLSPGMVLYLEIVGTWSPGSESPGLWSPGKIPRDCGLKVKYPKILDLGIQDYTQALPFA